MARGGPYPPFQGEYPIARQITLCPSWSAVRARNRIRRESLRTASHAIPHPMRRRFLPTLRLSRRAAGT